MTQEVPLEGGNMTGGVVRVGDTVRRPVGPQTPTIHRLLTHVHTHGVTWVPRVHGIDEQGREILDFLPGDVVHDDPDWLRGDEILDDVARALRQWHDATATFPRGPEDVWWWAGKEPVEVICHVDFAPYNHVFVDGRFTGVIDFDVCYPGPRLWDLAYTAYRYIPLTPGVGDDVPDGPHPDRCRLPRERQLERLASFLDAYAGDDAALRYPVAALLGWVTPRLIAMADWCDVQESRARREDGVMYRAHAHWIADGGLGDADHVTVRDVTD